jgi:hypothetical protein
VTDTTPRTKIADKDGNVNDSTHPLYVSGGSTARGTKTRTAPSIGTSATLALAANAARIEATFTNPTTNTATISLGLSGVTTATAIVVLAPGDIYIDDASDDAWYAAASSDATTLTVVETA